MNRCAAAVVSLALSVPALVSAQKQTKVVFASITDGGGSPITNLTAADFAVIEGDVKRPVTHVSVGEPMRIILLVDSSESIATGINSIRAGLKAFVDAVPAEDEVAMFSTGGQGRARQAPTTDRKKLQNAADGFTADGGGNALIDGLLVSDKRFLKTAEERWPVFVIVTTDPSPTGGVTELGPFNSFVRDLMARGGVAHAIVIRGQTSGVFFGTGSFGAGTMISNLMSHLADSTGGLFEPVGTASAVPDRLKAVAARIRSDQARMAARYKIEYAGDAKSAQPVEVQLPGTGIRIEVSPRRPF